MIFRAREHEVAVGLRVPGVKIRDPGCTAKTYPRFFADLAGLKGEGSRGSGTGVRG